MPSAKKSQAALEFLMTYGWAILIVLIVIGALAYFGVLNPQNLLPSKCTLPSGWSCTDYVSKAGAATGYVKIRLLNAIGTGIQITSFNATLDNGAASCASPAGSTYNLTNSGTLNLNTSGCTIPQNLASGGKYRWKLLIKYYPEGSDPSYTKTIQGEMFTTVEP